MKDNIFPKEFSWLLKEPHPRIMLESFKNHGIKEYAGEKNNPVILSWAKEIGGPVSNWYKNDSEAWCSLYLSMCAKRAGLPFPQGFGAVRALAWLDWGIKSPTPMLGDILVFSRKGGGHVGIYCGENRNSYLVHGGNQDNEVKFSFISKGRLVGKRRTPFENAQPINIRKIFLTIEGKLSQNEQ